MSATPPPALSYATPTRDRSILPLYLTYLVILGIPAAGIGYLVFGVIPLFVDVFMDFRTTLPAITRGFMTAALACRSPFVWPVAIPILLTSPLLLAKWTAGYQRTERLLVTLIVLAVVLFASLALWILVQVALLLPLMKLLHSLSGGES